MDHAHQALTSKRGYALFSVALVCLVMATTGVVYLGPLLSQGVQTTRLTQNLLQGRLAVRGASEWVWRWLGAPENLSLLQTKTPTASPVVPPFSDRQPTAQVELRRGPLLVIWDQVAGLEHIDVGSKIPLSYRVYEDLSFQGNPPAVAIGPDDTRIVTLQPSYRLVPTRELAAQYVIEGPGQSQVERAVINDDVLTVLHPGQIKVYVDYFTTPDGQIIRPTLYNGYLPLKLSGGKTGPDRLILLPGESTQLKNLVLDRTHTFIGHVTSHPTPVSVTNQGTWVFRPGTGAATLTVDERGAHLFATKPGTGTLSLTYGPVEGRTVTVEVQVEFVTPVRAARVTTRDGTGLFTEYSVVVAGNGQYEVRELQTIRE